MSTNQLASATLTQSKNVESVGALHTQNLCDGYHLGKIDCQSMITAGDTRLTQRIGETVTRLAGMDVEYHDNDDDDDYV